MGYLATGWQLEGSLASLLLHMPASENPTAQSSRTLATECHFLVVGIRRGETRRGRVSPNVIISHYIPLHFLGHLLDFSLIFSKSETLSPTGGFQAAACLVRGWEASGCAALPEAAGPSTIPHTPLGRQPHLALASAPCCPGIWEPDGLLPR